MAVKGLPQAVWAMTSCSYLRGSCERHDRTDVPHRDFPNLTDLHTKFREDRLKDTRDLTVSYIKFTREIS